MENIQVKEQLTKEDRKVLSANSIRQLEVLSKYSVVDVKNRLVTIPFHMEKASDIISPLVGSKENPVLNNDILEDISTTLHSVPEEFKVNFDLQINDYEGYEPINIMNSIQDSLEVFNYDVTKQKKSNAIKMSFLLFIGVFFFALLYYLCSFNLFGDNEIAHNTIHEIVYTIACVLLWEGIYILFLPDNSYNSIHESLLFRINSFILRDNKNNILENRDIKLIKKDWVLESKKDRRHKKILLACGTGSMCFGAILGLDVIGYARSISQNPLLGILMIVITITVGLLLFFTGVSAICYYSNRGRIKNYLVLFTSISLGLGVAFLVLHIINSFTKGVGNTYSLVIVCVTIVLLLGVLISAYKLHKKEKLQSK